MFYINVSFLRALVREHVVLHSLSLSMCAHDVFTLKCFVRHGPHICFVSLISAFREASGQEKPFVTRQLHAHPSPAHPHFLFPQHLLRGSTRLSPPKKVKEDAQTSLCDIAFAVGSAPKPRSIAPCRWRCNLCIDQRASRELAAAPECPCAAIGNGRSSKFRKTRRKEARRMRRWTGRQQPIFSIRERLSNSDEAYMWRQSLAVHLRVNFLENIRFFVKHLLKAILYSE